MFSGPQKRGNTVLADFIYPNQIVFQKLWIIYFKLLKLSGKLLKNWNKVFNELDSLIMKTEWKDAFPKILLDKGFTKIVSETLTFETSSIVCAKKP